MRNFERDPEEYGLSRDEDLYREGLAYTRKLKEKDPPEQTGWQCSLCEWTTGEKARWKATNLFREHNSEVHILGSSPAQLGATLEPIMEGK